MADKVIGAGSKILPINLPVEFAFFDQEREVVIDLAEGREIKLTFKLAGSFDTVWASTEATSSTLDLRTMGASFVPKILASTLVKVNDRDLMHYVPARLVAVREALNPNERPYLNEERRGLVSQWVYEAIISRIPLELLSKVYREHVKDWFDSAGGLVPLDTPPLENAEPQNAQTELSE
ncbi:hypothetical protein [Yersinia ruckeri]|uniref:hypothetical protein n=1 Tax=Yersinia ruckeri TaxID=29486 RepID=UPI0022386899|nr:hypothetical protein [Yersinia ruckeri]MCW6598633.1 hypothetical protein [Yersinia ruckeri]